MGLEVGRKRAPSSRRSGGRSRSYARHARALLLLRDEQITAIALLRLAKAEPSPFLNKAETLLTRHWAGANWQAREEILRSVKWLLNLARLPSAWPVPKVRTRKSSKRHRRVP
jgi:hypothetical protein